MKIETSHQEKPERIIPPSVFPYFAKHSVDDGLVVMFVSEWVGIVVESPGDHFRNVGDNWINGTSLYGGRWLPCEVGYSATFTQDR